MQAVRRKLPKWDASWPEGGPRVSHCRSALTAFARSLCSRFACKRHARVGRLPLCKRQRAGNWCACGASCRGRAISPAQRSLAFACRRVWGMQGACGICVGAAVRKPMVVGFLPDWDGEGPFHFETGCKCLEFWARSPVRAIWHPTKQQVKGTANRTP